MMTSSNSGPLLSTRRLLTTTLAVGLISTAAASAAQARTGSHDHPARSTSGQMQGAAAPAYGPGPAWWVPGMQEGRNAAMIDNQAAVNGDRAILQAEQQYR